MADIELVIKIPEEDWKFIKDSDGCRWSRAILEGVINGTPLPEGHGRLIDADYLREDFKASKRISFAERMDISCIVDHAPTIIEADKEYEVEVITQGNCMMCGKELTEGLFFCKECEAKDNKVESEDKE